MGYDQILLPPWYTPVDIQWAFFLTVDEQSAQKLDNEIYARAAKLQIVDVPTSIAPSGTGVTPEIVESWLTSQSGPFAIVPGTGTSIWHAITNWGSSAVWFNVLEKATGEVHRVFIGDTVVIKFSDGTTPRMDCAIMATITTCENVYGQSQCESALRAVSVPCDW